MRLMKARILETMLRKKETIRVSAMETCCFLWALWPCSIQEENSIPRDVPKGHLVVYVGEESKRFVIKITLLKHPLFKALLDRAKEEYDFTAHSKLCIPCDEHVFLTVVQFATSSKDKNHLQHFFVPLQSTHGMNHH